MADSPLARYLASLDSETGATVAAAAASSASEAVPPPSLASEVADVRGACRSLADELVAEHAAALAGMAKPYTDAASEHDLARAAAATDSTESPVAGTSTELPSAPHELCRAHEHTLAPARRPAAVPCVFAFLAGLVAAMLGGCFLGASALCMTPVLCSLLGGLVIAWRAAALDSARAATRNAAAALATALNDSRRALALALRTARECEALSRGYRIGPVLGPISRLEATAGGRGDGVGRTQRRALRNAVLICSRACEHLGDTLTQLGVGLSPPQALQCMQSPPLNASADGPPPPLSLRALAADVAACEALAACLERHACRASDWSAVAAAAQTTSPAAWANDVGAALTRAANDLAGVCTALGSPASLRLQPVARASGTGGIGGVDGVGVVGAVGAVGASFTAYCNALHALESVGAGIAAHAVRARLGYEDWAAAVTAGHSCDEVGARRLAAAAALAGAASDVAAVAGAWIEARGALGRALADCNGSGGGDDEGGETASAVAVAAAAASPGAAAWRLDDGDWATRARLDLGSAVAVFEAQPDAKSDDDSAAGASDSGGGQGNDDDGGGGDVFAARRAAYKPLSLAAVLGGSAADGWAVRAAASALSDLPSSRADEANDVASDDESAASDDDIVVCRPSRVRYNNGQAVRKREIPSPPPLGSGATASAASTAAAPAAAALMATAIRVQPGDETGVIRELASVLRGRSRPHETVSSSAAL